MDTFAQRKAAALAELASPVPDKSPKGGVDAPIIPLLELLNSHPSFFTTSSCSGRISILLSNPDSSTENAQNQENGKKKEKKKAGGGRWLYVSHEKAGPEKIVGLLFGDRNEEDVGFEAVLRFEPMILAVDCRDLDAARQLVSVAVSSGFRESGKYLSFAVRCL
jgi:tRNA wybutosine-synthesizing protein 3